ncbi:MAG: hypothetical protein MUE42_04700 [Opitutaceae bacterium]|jgi:hypothetical protein|nr:hypothetical protein [Opitutaceae bacterium]
MRASPAVLPFLLRLGLVLAACWLAGCQSFASRAKEKAGVFDSLDADTRARLERREIRVGDTPDMVYIALGRPTEKQEITTASGPSSVWLYSVSWQQYEGTRLVGYRREFVADPGSKNPRVIYTPDYQPIYTPRVEDRTRVVFQGGRVTSVEEALESAVPEGGSVR